MAVQLRPRCPKNLLSTHKVFSANTLRLFNTVLMVSAYVRCAVFNFKLAVACDVPLHLAFLESGIAARRDINGQVLDVVLLLAFEYAPDVVSASVLLIEANDKFHGQYAL